MEIMFERQHHSVISILTKMADGNSGVNPFEIITAMLSSSVLKYQTTSVTLNGSTSEILIVPHSRGERTLMIGQN